MKWLLIPAFILLMVSLAAWFISRKDDDFDD